jgi:hypothetical protein
MESGDCIQESHKHNENYACIIVVPCCHNFVCDPNIEQTSSRGGVDVGRVGETAKVTFSGILIADMLVTVVSTGDVCLGIKAAIGSPIL